MAGGFPFRLELMQKLLGDALEQTDKVDVGNQRDKAVAALSSFSSAAFVCFFPYPSFSPSFRGGLAPSPF